MGSGVDYAFDTAYMFFNFLNGISAFNSVFLLLIFVMVVSIFLKIMKGD